MRIAAALAVVVGAVGGYALARHAGAEASVLAGVAWWLVTALVLSFLARGATATVAIVSLFLVVWVGVPVVGAGVALGLRDRTAAALDEVFGDLEEFGDTGELGDSGSNDAYNDCLADPDTTLEECEQLAG